MLTCQFKSKRTQSLYNLSKASWMEGENNAKENSEQSRNNQRKNQRKGQTKNKKGSTKNSAEETKHIINVKRRNISRTQAEVMEHAVEKKKLVAGYLFQAQVQSLFAKLASENRYFQKSTQYCFKQKTTKEIKKKLKQGETNFIQVEIDMMMQNADSQQMIALLKKCVRDQVGEENFWIWRDIFNEDKAEDQKKKRAKESRFIFQCKRNFFPVKQNNQLDTGRVQKFTNQLARIVEFVKFITKPKQDLKISYGYSQLNDGHPPEYPKNQTKPQMSGQQEKEQVQILGDLLFLGNSIFYLCQQKNHIYQVKPQKEELNIQITLIINKGIKEEDFKAKFKGQGNPQYQLCGWHYMKEHLNADYVVFNVLGLTNLSKNFQKQLEDQGSYYSESSQSYQPSQMMKYQSNLQIQNEQQKQKIEAMQKHIKQLDIEHTKQKEQQRKQMEELKQQNNAQDEKIEKQNKQMGQQRKQMEELKQQKNAQDEKIEKQNKQMEELKQQNEIQNNKITLLMQQMLALQNKNQSKDEVKKEKIQQAQGEEEK